MHKLSATSDGSLGRIGDSYPAADEWAGLARRDTRVGKAHRDRKAQQLNGRADRTQRNELREHNRGS
jgi:hypothetical protein